MCAPLTLPADTVSLHVLADASVLEVFAEQGQAAITTSVYPRADSDALGLHAAGGPAVLLQFDLWHMRSAWDTN